MSDEREAWQITRKEWIEKARKQARNYKFPGEFIINAGFNHRRLVAQAVYEGKPVSYEVVKDYPDLLEKWREMRNE